MYVFYHTKKFFRVDVLLKAQYLTCVTNHLFTSRLTLHFSRPQSYALCRLLFLHVLFSARRGTSTIYHTLASWLTIVSRRTATVFLM